MKTLGLEINTLNADVSKQLGLDLETGVVITAVQADSAAETAGLEPGMVIVQVDRQDVSNVKEFEKIVSADHDGSLLMLIKTQQGSRFVVIKQ